MGIGEESKVALCRKMRSGPFERKEESQVALSRKERGAKWPFGESRGGREVALWRE